MYMLHHSKNVTLWLNLSPLISLQEVNQTTQVCWGHKLPSCTPPDLQPAWLEFTQICPTGKLALIQQRSLYTKEWHTCTRHSGFSQNHYEKTAFISYVPTGNQNCLIITDHVQYKIHLFHSQIRCRLETLGFLIFSSSEKLFSLHTKQKQMLCTHVC